MRGNSGLPLIAVAELRSAKWTGMSTNDRTLSPSTGLRAWCLPLLVLGGWLWSAPLAGAESIVIPGGTQALVTLLGAMDQSPDGFVSSLNRSLLATVDPAHDWKKSDKRLQLVQYLEDIERLRQVFPGRLVVGTAPKPAKKAFIQLAGECGFKAKLKKGSFDLQPAEGENKERRRRLCAALDLDLHRLARSFGNETAEIEFVSEEVELPFSYGDWAAITGKAPDRSKPLKALAMDQRFSLVLEGNRRLADAVLESAGNDLLRWTHDRAPSAFYRYASSLEMEAGKLRLPGGEKAHAVWREIVGEDPQRTSDFVKELLTRRNGRAAYLWQAMHFADEDVASFYLGTAGVSLGDDRKYVKKLFGKLDNTATGSFESRYGGDLGFPVLVRSIPIASDGSGLVLPGGSGIWFQAIKGNRSPIDSADLAREVTKGRQRTLDDGEFLLKALTEETDMERWKLPVLPRLIRAANIFSQDQHELLSPGNVILVARASDEFPAALDILDALEFEDARTIEAYLLSVARLARNPDLVERELAVTTLQGGVEWLRGLAHAGKVAPDDLEERLGHWSRIHSTPRQLDWVVSLLRSLPEASMDVPGRGPFENAMIEALIPPEDKSFQWKDLEYEGARSSDLAEAMAETLVAQDIPAADLLVAIADQIGGLEEVLASEDLAESHRLAKELRASVKALPQPSFASGIKDKDLLRRVAGADRVELLSILDKPLKVKKGKKLPRQLDELDRFERLLAPELRSFLLAPAYLVAMGDRSNPLLLDSGLIRKHLMIEYDAGGKNRDLSWAVARVSRSDESEIGTFVRGSLSSVARALADFNLSAMASGGTGTSTNLDRARLWYRDLVTTRWHEYSAEQSALVAEIRAVGESTLEKVVGGSASQLEVDLTRRRVPSARLERAIAAGNAAGLVSPSDAFSIGLLAIEAEVLDGESRRSFDEVALRVGDDWRRRLHRVGTSTPMLNGRTRPWVGAWPSYEAVERESRPAALNERELLDLRIALLDYLGRHDLPGGVGADLARKTLEFAIAELRVESSHDWESWVRWVSKLDDDFFDSRMRECLKDGLYRLQSF